MILSFLPCSQKIIGEPNKVEAFLTQVKNEQLFVADQTFAEAFVTNEIYLKNELNFSRLVLQEIDRCMTSYNELPDYSTINTIEHLAPQTLDDHWKAHLGDDAVHFNWPTIVNTVGNLCLNSQPLNSHNGQNPFKQKQQDLTEVSALARDIKQRQEPWNIEAINARSTDLAKKALEVWNWSL